MYEIKRILDITYSKVHPEDCKLDLYLPETKLPCPVLIYIHGGGLEAGTRRNTSGWIEALVSEWGIAVVSLDYRMYPNAHFPDFIEDCAEGTAWVTSYGRTHSCFNKYYIGGSSAGAYLTMMLYFAENFLLKHGLSPDEFDGYIFDAGQPTTHFNILRERRIDTRAIRVDDAAPVFYVDKQIEEPEKKPPVLVLVAENDIPNRLEQNEMFIGTMINFGFIPSRITKKYMAGFSHCGYVNARDSEGKSIFANILANFIDRGN
ncbi:MAG TPA: alpha/beta hydrolase [Clostridiales bacterium]|nr:alpha/beta hydrolase [Clostridiales bacterium]